MIHMCSLIYIYINFLFFAGQFYDSEMSAATPAWYVLFLLIIIAVALFLKQT